MEHIACPACGVENEIVRSTCEKCGADLVVIKSILNNANRHYNTALELAQQGRHDEAAAELRAAIELWGKNPHFHNLLGTIYARKGLYDLAIREWETTLSLDAAFDKAHRSIEKARKAEIYLYQERQQRPFKMVAIWTGVVAAAAVLALILLGVRLQSSHRETHRLRMELASQPPAPDTHQYALLLSRRDERIRTLESQLESLQKDLQQRDGTIVALEKKVKDLEELPPTLVDDARAQELVEQIQSLRRDRDQLEEELKENESFIATLQGDIRALENQLQTRQEELTRMMSELEGAARQIQNLRTREESVAESFQLMQQGRHRELLGHLGRMEEQRVFPELVQDLKVRATHQVALQEDPLFRARQEATALNEVAREEQERAYFAGLKILEADEAAGQGNLERSVALLQAALEIHPQNPDARNRLEQIRERIAQRDREIAEQVQASQQALQEGRLDEALKGFEAVLSASPEHPLARAGLTRTQEAQRQARQAEEARQRRLEELARIAPRAAQEGQIEQALELYQEWLRMEPGNRSVQREISRLERQEQRRLSDMNSRMASGQTRLGRGEIQAAISEFEAALALARLPQERQSIESALQAARQELERIRSAEQERQEALEQALKNAREYYQDAIFDRALIEVDKVLELEPGHREARQLRRSIESELAKQNEE